MQSLEVVAKELRQNGFIPIRLNGKVPSERGWQKLTPETESLESIESKFSTHDGNIGLLAIDHQVIDWDHLGENGELFREWLETYPHMQDTIRVKSGSQSDGYHYYVRINNEQERLSTNLYYNGVHIGELLGKTKSGTVKQSVFPPSIHPDTGNEYQFLGKFPFGLDDIIVIDDLASIGLTVKNNHSSEDKKIQGTAGETKEVKDVNNTSDCLSLKSKKVKNKEKFLRNVRDISLEKLRCASEGERNTVLFKQSFHLATFFADEPDENLIRHELLAIGVGIGLDVNEASKTRDSGWAKGSSSKIRIIEDQNANVKNKGAEDKKEDENKLQKVLDTLNMKYKFRRNTLTHRYEYNRLDGEYKVLRDSDFNSILNDLRLNDEIEAWRQGLREIIESDCSPEFQVFKDYFARITPWDGSTDHIRDLANMVKLKNPEDFDVWFLYFKRWLMATVATWLERGVNHNCLILQGNQGIGKTKFLNRLCPLKDYIYCGFIDPTNKDAQIEASKKGLINLDELEGSTKYDWSHLKTLLTQETITLREPYGRYSEDFIRHASFCGSINKSNFLDDDEYRRWLVVEIVEAKFDFSEELIEKAYSQAYTLLNNGEKYWFDVDEIQTINVQNQKYQIMTAEEERLLQFFKVPEANDVMIKELTASQIRGFLIEKSKERDLSLKRLGSLLKKYKFPRKQKHGQGYYYSVVPLFEVLNMNDPNLANHGVVVCENN